MTEDNRNKILALIAIIGVTALIVSGFYLDKQKGIEEPVPENPGYSTPQPSVGIPISPSPSLTPSDNPSLEPTVTPPDDMSRVLPPLAETGESVSLELDNQLSETLIGLVESYLLINPNENLAERNQRLQGKIAVNSPLWDVHPAFGDLTESSYNNQAGAAGYAEVSTTRGQGGWLDDYRVMVSFKYVYIYPGGVESNDFLISGEYVNDFSLTYNTSTGEWELNKLGPAS